MENGLFWCSVLPIARLAFCATDLFPGNFIDFRFMIFTEFLMKNLAPILIHVSKIFNCMVSFKMLLSMYLVIVENEF